MTRAWIPQRPATAEKLAADRARRERITSLVAAGEPITKVAMDEGISRQRVSQIIHRHGLVIGLPRQVAQGRRESAALAAAIRAGVSLAELRERTGRPVESLRRSLRRVGIVFERPVRPLPPHGTYRYKRYGCRCEHCLAANAAYARSRYQSKAAKERMREATKEYARQHPDRIRAYHAVRSALKAGTLPKPDCCGCGRVARLHAHHDDYSKPLDVMWLCGVCHRARHQMLRQQKAA